MKHKLLILLISILLGIGCKKEIVRPPVDPKPIQSESTQKVAAGGLILWEYYDSSFGSFFKCAGTPGGCGAEITVSGISNLDILDNIYQAIDAKDPIEVSHLFSTYKTELTDLFSEDIVSKTAEGQLTLEKGTGKPDRPTIYLIFKDLEGNLELAQPIIN